MKRIVSLIALVVCLTFCGCQAPTGAAAMPAAHIEQQAETQMLLLKTAVKSKKAKYTDATGYRTAFMKGINKEKTRNDAEKGKQDKKLNAIAQKRARIMASQKRKQHIGDGYSEAVGTFASKKGIENKARNCVHHCPDLMEAERFGIGIARGRDKLYYYCVIGVKGPGAGDTLPAPFRERATLKPKAK